MTGLDTRNVKLTCDASVKFPTDYGSRRRAANEGIDRVLLCPFWLAESPRPPSR